MTATDSNRTDSDERFSLLEMDGLPVVSAAPTLKIVPTPTITTAPAAAPSAFQGYRSAIAACTEASTLEAIAAGLIKAYPDKAHPVRSSLRPIWGARMALVTLALLWHRLFASLALAIEARPHVWADGLPHSLPEGRILPVVRPGLDLGTVLGGIASEGASNAAVAGVIPENDLPIGVGITHTPTGPDVFTVQREAAANAAAAIRATADATTLALAQRLVVADSPLAWWEIGWLGTGSITRAELIAACDQAPAPKVNSTQLARTIDSLRGTHDAAMISGRPMGVKVRWQIGRGKQHAAFVGAEYGKVLAIVDLMTDGTLSFAGDETIAAEVRAEYERLMGDEVLRPGDVTAWLSLVLRKQYGAVRSGERYLLAPQHKDAARELCSKIAKVWAVGGWVLGRLGDDGKPELGVTYQDVATVLGGIWQGLAGEVAEAEERWAKTVADAKEGKVGARACTSEVLRLDGDRPGEGLAARVDDFRVLGAGPLASLRARVVALRTAVLAAQVAANDDATVRYANLELT